MRIRATREMAAGVQNQLQDFIQGEEVLAGPQGYIKGQTITQGSLRLGLWKVSWPILVTTFCLSIVDLVHVQCAGILSTKAQAMIGVCDQFMMICAIVITSLATAGTALASKAYGANRKEDLVSLTGQLLVLLLVMAILMIVSMLSLSTALLASFSGCVNNCGVTIHEGKRYLDIVAFLLIPCAVVSTINATFVGVGNARIQLITLSVMAGVDVLVNYLLLVKGWPVSDTGITGIAIASISGYSVAALIAALAWWRSDFRVRDKLSKPSTITSPFLFVRPLLVSGVPAALQDIAWCSSTFVLFWILSLLDAPAAAVAAWTIGQRLEAFAILPLSALSMAVLVAVGQNIGSNRLQRAWQASYSMTLLAIGLLVLAGIVLFCCAAPLAESATTDQTTRLILVGYIRVAAFGLPFAALEAVLGASLQAMNDSRIPVIFSFVSNWVIGLSLAYLLAVNFSHGAFGVWLSLAVSTCITGSLVALRFLTKVEWSGLSPLSPITVPVEAVSDSAQCEEADNADNKRPLNRGKRVQEIELPAPGSTNDLTVLNDDNCLAEQD